MTILVFFFFVVSSLRPIFPLPGETLDGPGSNPVWLGTFQRGGRGIFLGIWGLFSEGEEVSFVFCGKKKLLQVIVVERGTEDEKVEEMEPPVVRLHYICSHNMITICNSENGCWLFLLHILSCWCCLE